MPGLAAGPGGTWSVDNAQVPFLDSGGGDTDHARVNTERFGHKD